METAGLTSRLFLLLNVSTVVYLVLCQLYLCLLFDLLVLVSKGEGKKKENKIGNPLIPSYILYGTIKFFIFEFHLQPLKIFNVHITIFLQVNLD